jgi:hypothetical protein
MQLLVKMGQSKLALYLKICMLYYACFEQSFLIFLSGRKMCGIKRAEKTKSLFICPAHFFKS